MRAHAIVVDSFDDKLIDEAHAEAIEIFSGVAPVTEITKSTVNGHRSFMVAPDGSKEGWPESDAGDRARLRFKTYARSKSYDDGSTALHWIEVFFADDEGEVGIEDHDGRESHRSDTRTYADLD